MKFAHFILAAILLQIAVTSPVSYLKSLSKEDAARLAAWTPDQNMWELSGQFEGDMVLAPSQRNGVIKTSLRWPNRVIPYEFSTDFNASEKQTITNALTKEYAKTCITVRPKKSTDKDYVYITGQNTGCWSNVGRIGGRQELNLQRNGCIWYGTIAHEFLHAAGFYHQQSATERDNFVTIMWNNIQKGKEHNFNKYESNVVSSFGETYDYSSVMHYGKTAFTSNGQPTIVPHDPKATIGQRDGLSSIDIKKLNKMYDCN